MYTKEFYQIGQLILRNLRYLLKNTYYNNLKNKLLKKINAQWLTVQAYEVLVCSA